MKKLKKGFRKIFLIATLISLIFASCKQPSNKSDDPKPDNITVTVEKGEHVKSVTPSSFQLAKGTTLGATELRKKLRVEFEADYEFSKICLNNASGKEITDAKKYKFDANSTICIVSQKVSASPVLISLKIDEVDVRPINDVMDVGTSQKEKVLVETIYSPNDASIEFDPALDSDNNWTLTEGANTLKIKVKKGTDEKTYTVALKKMDAGIPVLSRLTVAGQTMEGGKLDSNKKLAFAVPDKTTEVPVEAITNTEGATIEFEPQLTDGKLTLNASSHATEFKVIVKKGAAKTEYTVFAKKTVQALLITGGKKMGIDSKPADEDVVKILNHEKNVNITVAGNVLEIISATTKMGWKSFKVNGQEVTPFNFQGFNSICFTKVPLASEKGQSIDVKIEIETREFDTATKKPKDDDDAPIYEEFNFKVTRQEGEEGKVDVPAHQLIVGGKNVINRLVDFVALCSGPRPEYETGNPAIIEVRAEAEFKEAIIDGKPSSVMSKKDPYGETYWYAQNTIDVSSGEKEIDVVIKPKDNDVETYNVTTWKFKLKFKTPKPIKVDYEINGQGKYSLPSAFILAVEKGNKPYIKVKGKAVNLKISADAELENIKINDATTINGSEMQIVPGLFGSKSYVATHSIPLEGGKKDIKIEVNPKDKGAASKKVIQFEAEGDNILETINPVFEKIGADENLPKEDFLDKLADNSEPTYEVFGSVAKFVISISEYEKKFLCEKVEIDGTEVELEKVENFIADVYKIEKDIAVEENTPKSVKVEFIGKNNVAQTLTWKFKLKGGGKKPTIPQSEIRIFKINEFGTRGIPFNQAFLDHLTDDTKPMFDFYGTEAKVTLGTYEDELINNVEFKLDGTLKETVIPTTQGYSKQASYTYTLSDTNEHVVEIIINPKSEQYDSLKYSFKLQSLDSKKAPSYIFGIDKIIRARGYKATLKAENATLLAQITSDTAVMEKVEIGEAGQQLEECTITNFQGSKGKVWSADKDVTLTPNVEKIFVIRITPKDTATYPVVECKYYLTGTTVPNNNAEFVFNANKKPIVFTKNTWKAGLEGNKYIDDYGAEKVTLIARTVSPRANVKWQFVNPLDDTPIAGKNGDFVSNNKGTHTAQDIELYVDKPTKVKAWVIAEDGHTIDNEKGGWTFTYNNVPLWWSYDKDETADGFKTAAYDTIEIKKNDVKDGKIAILVAPWNSDDGYSVDNTGLPSEQAPFENKGAFGDFQTYYKTIIDVSKMIAEPPTQDKVEVLLKMNKKGIPCLTYKITVKVKS